MQFQPTIYVNTMISATTLSRTTTPHTYLFLGVTMKIILSSAQTGGQFCVIEGIMPAGEAPPAHIHLREDESMLLLEGELEVSVGADTFTLAPGHAYFAPRGVPQRLRNTGATPARTLAIMTPGGFDDLVRHIGIPVFDGVPAAPPVAPTPEQFAAIIGELTKFGIELTSMPEARAT